MAPRQRGRSCPKMAQFRIFRALISVVDHKPAKVLAQASAVDAAIARREQLGELAGVPVTVKVNVDQEDFATTNGVKLNRDNITKSNNPVVDNLRKAGAVLLGRSNCPAFSFRWFTDNQLYGHTKNPRDPGELFHADGTIEVAWFEGLFSDSVDASMRMGASDSRTRHVITAPVVTFQGDGAVAETNAIIVAENVELGVGAMTYNRFYDRIEKRDGTWKITNRQAIYDMGSLTFSNLCNGHEHHREC